MGRFHYLPPSADVVPWPPARDWPDREPNDDEARIAAHARRIAVGLAQADAEDRRRRAVAAVARRREQEAGYRYKRRGGPPKPTKKAVRCLETGREFPSAAAASREYGMHRAAVSESVRFGHRCKGIVNGRRKWLRFEWAKLTPTLLSA